MGEWTHLARNVEPSWSPERSRAVRQAIRARASRRRATYGVLALAAVLALAFGIRRWQRVEPPVALAPAPPVVATPVVEADAVTPAGDADVVKDRDRAYTVRKGSARFVVAHDEARPFVVRAGDVEVEDLGTVFTVALEDGRVRVSVEKGSVRVKHDGTTTDVEAGQRADVAAHPEPAPVVTAAKVPPKRDEVAALLDAADGARAKGRDEEAARSLRKILDEHAQDPRADVAAFTLGRVLLDDLGDPAGAADAFAKARARGGPIAEDALGREVLARAKAGQTDRARALADAYLRAHPQGVRAKEVGRFASPR